MPLPPLDIVFAKPIEAWSARKLRTEAMVTTAYHEKWGDLQIIRWRIFALTLAAVAAVEIFVFSLHVSHYLTLIFAIVAASLYELSADKLFKRCAGLPVDELAWEEFFRRYQHDIRVAICRVIGFSTKGRYSHLFPDVMQKFNLRLLEHGRRALFSFRGKTDLEAKAFLRKVACNIALNTLSQEAGSQAWPLERFVGSQDDGLGRNDVPIDSTNINENYLLLVDTIEHCLQGVLKGKNKYRNILIFKLAVFDGLSPKEIAEIPGLGVGSSHAVEQQITRIRRKLRLHLKKE